MVVVGPHLARAGLTLATASGNAMVAAVSAASANREYFEDMFNSVRLDGPKTFCHDQQEAHIRRKDSRQAECFDLLM